MKSSRGILALALCAMLALLLCGCDASVQLYQSAQPSQPSPSAQTQSSASVDFDALMRETLVDVVDTNTFSLSMNFEAPEAAGLDSPGLSIGVGTAQTWSENAQHTREVLSKLEDVDAEALDSEDAETLELLKDTLDRNLALEDYYYQLASPLGINGGPAILGTMIGHMPYKDRAAFERFFALYGDLQSQFEEMVALEKERQTNGYGLTRDEIEMVIEECEKLIDGEPPAAVQLMDEAIDKADFLSDAEKQELKQENAETVAADLIPAYEYLIGELEGLEGRSGVAGMAGMPNGREAYAAALYSAGIDMSPEEILDYLAEVYADYAGEIRELIQSVDPAELQEVLSSPNGIPFTDMTDASEIVAYLEENIQADYPPVETFEYEVQETPEALRAPGVLAYYVMRPLDAPDGEPSNIYINQDDESTSYLTLAHESFPGHMYQDAYTHALERPYVRQYAERIYQPFIEGWGVYSSVIASNYASLDPTIARIGALDEAMTFMLYAYMDIGVNYLGWDEQEMVDEVRSGLGVNLEGMADAIYPLMAVRYGEWINYGLGVAMLLDMRAQAEESLGENFSAKEFHQAILDAAPASMTTIQQAVDQYIEEAQENPEASNLAAAA